MSLETNRLHIRPLCMDDAAFILRMRSDQDTMQYIDRPVMGSISESESLIANILELCINNSAWFWVIELKENNQMVGVINFWNYRVAYKRAELGLMMHKSFCQNGYMKEAAKKVCSYGFSKLGFNSIEAHTRPENIGSRKTLISSGFIVDGCLRENAYFKNRYWDTMIFTRLKTDS